MCYKITLVLIVLFCTASARKHTVTFKDETRHQIHLSSFGFVTGGDLFVDFSLSINNVADAYGKFGFTVDRTLTGSDSPLWDDLSCRLNKTAWDFVYTPAVYFVIDFDKKQLVIHRSGYDFEQLSITNEYPPPEISMADSGRDHRDIDILSDTYLSDSQSNRRRGETSNSTYLPSASASSSMISTNPVHSSVLDASRCAGANICAHFRVSISTPEEEGEYHLIFHNCLARKLQITVAIEEVNPGSYLSYGQQRLPTLFFYFGIVYIVVGLLWLWILCSSKKCVFRIHYVMLALVYNKSLAMLSQGIHYYFIGVEGHLEEAYALFYYIMYLVMGIFMFVTIVLIGAGWEFVKRVLSRRDKTILVVIIPLQVLLTVAMVILEESDQGMSYYNMWKLIFRVIDLICCGAILFPVVWSIRHLQQTGQSNDKKIKVFRHFYIMIVCYIYSTRIVVLLIQVSARFELEWLDEMFVELVTLVFFIVTGYKFRPASDYQRFSEDPTLQDQDLKVQDHDLEFQDCDQEPCLQNGSKTSQD